VSTRTIRLRNLLAIVAVLASLVALGCWDNRREMARVLDQGYATSAQIVAAQFQRTAPFAIDGWRPRFVEQALSVDLQWQGHDGKTHVFRKVPVSERFEHSIVSGEQVKLIAVPVKAIDDDTSVPVLTLDAAERLQSLKAWLGASSAIALAGWIGIAAMTLWRRLAPAPAASRPAAAQPAIAIPGQRILIGLVAFAVGGFLTYNATALGEPTDDGAKSVEVTAEITAAEGPPYTVRLGWRDGQGGVHHFGPLPISGAFWNRITRDGKLETHETRVRVHVDDSMGRPEILDDAPGERWQTKAVLAGGIMLLLVGAGCLLSAGRMMRRGR
jgi:hypothetical protein